MFLLRLRGSFLFCLYFYHVFLSLFSFVQLGIKRLPHHLLAMSCTPPPPPLIVKGFGCCILCVFAQMLHFSVINPSLLSPGFACEGFGSLGCLICYILLSLQTGCDIPNSIITHYHKQNVFAVIQTIHTQVTLDSLSRNNIQIE